MLIGIDGSRAFMEDKTGTENYSFQLLKALALVDTENDYLIYLRSDVIPAYELESRSRLPGSRIKSGMTENGWPANFKFKVINFPRFWTQIGLSLQTFIDPLDVLFVPSHTLPLIRKPGLKTVITVHDLGAEYLPGLHQLKQILYLKLMTYYQLKTASKIIAVSEATKKDLVKKIGINSEKIKVIYEGADKTIFKKISKDIVIDIVKKYDLERGKYFLFVGTIQPRKNLERLITAFGKFLYKVNSVNKGDNRLKIKDERLKIKDSKNKIDSLILNPKSLIKLVIVGQKGWKSDTIYKLPEELGIEDRVVFTGRISDADLAGLYNGAAALTYPSLFEGFGLPILEAMACGCPVITSNISSMPEVAGGAALIVNPEKEEDITASMIKIIDDDSLKNSLIQLGLDRVKDFNWQKTATQTLEVLKEAVKTNE